MNMAPKGKTKKSGKKVKPAEVVDALSTEEMNKDQLEEHIVRLREELDREREEKSYFQLERDRIQSLWETCHRDLDQIQTELNQRRREREEAEERHRLEINVYKQKLKHVLSEQHGAVSELKTDRTAAQNLDQNQNTDRELVLVQQKNSLQTALREKEHHRDQSLKTLQLKHQVELMELMNNYDRKIREVEEKYREASHALSQEHEKRLSMEVSEVEQAAKTRISELQTEHERAMRAAEEYYTSLHNKLESDHREVTKELLEVRAKLSRVNKKLSEAKAENVRLKGALHKSEKQLPELQQRLQEHQREKAQEEKSRARLKQVEEELRGLKMEHTLLLQAFQKVEAERDQLKRSQLELVLDIQRRNGLKEALLQKKVSALSLELQNKEALLRGAAAEVKTL